MADRSVLVRIRGDANDLIRAAAAGRAAISGLRKEIDTTNDRTAWLAQGFLALAPALTPLGAAGVPVLAGLATQMTIAGVAAGSLGLAFNGVFDAFKSLNDYQLDPTAENFTKLQQAMDQIGPTGEEFVRFLDEVGPQFTQLQMAAREGMFPGMEEGITHLLDLLPQLQDIVFNVSRGIGELSADAGAGLSGEGFAEFFDYLESDAKPILIDMGHTAGNFAEGLANMLVAFGPISEGFSNGFRDMSQTFADWSHGFDETTGFAEFVDYVDHAGPMVMDFLGSLVSAFVQVAEAAAPIGNIMVPALTKLLDVIGELADTPLGTMFIGAAAGMSLYGRTVAALSVTMGGLGKALFGLDKGFAAAIRGQSGYVAKMSAVKQASGLAAGGVGILALSMTDIDEKAGLSNTAMGALLGTMILPGWGTAIGALGGGLMDLAAANDNLEDAISRADQALASLSTASLRQAQSDLQEMLQQTEQGFTFGSFFTDLTHLGDDADFGTAAMNKLTGAADKAQVSLADVNQAIRGGAELGDFLAGPLGLINDAFHTAAQSADEFRESVGAAFAMLDKRAALRDARAAIRDFNETLKDAPDDMRKGSAAYDQVQEALDNIARKSLEAAEKLKGMARVNYLDRQREALIDAAREMGKTGKQARDLADDMGLLNRQKAVAELDADARPLGKKLREAHNLMTGWGHEKSSSTIDADNKPAKGKVDETNHWLDFLNGRRADPTIGANADPWWSTVHQVNAYHIPDKYVQIRAINNVRTHGAFADGGTIPGPRVPYGDKVLFMGAPGEEVITNRNGEADRFRADRDAGRIPRYADGGTVAARAAASAPQVSVAAPQLSLAGARFVLEVPGWGQLTTRVVRAEMAADQTYHARLDDRP